MSETPGPVAAGRPAAGCADDPAPARPEQRVERLQLVGIALG